MAGNTEGSHRVTFTKASADRIARAVKQVESGDRGGIPFVGSPRIQGGDGFKLRLATFTGSWQRGTYKTVTIHGSTDTASVYNWCNSSVVAECETGSTTSTRYVIFGKVKGTNSVVEIQTGGTNTCCTNSMESGGINFAALPGYSAGEIQMLGHSAGSTTGSTACEDQASLRWYSIVTCTTATT